MLDVEAAGELEEATRKADRMMDVLLGDEEFKRLPAKKLREQGL